MKKQIITMLAITIASFTAQAQEEHEHDHGKDKKEKEAPVIKPFENVNDSVKAQIGNVLVAYYQIKDALVADNEDMTSKNAKAFRKTLERVDVKKMTSEQNTFFMELQPKLDYDAEHIQGAPHIDHMREHFESFSNNMWALIKSFNATNGATAYWDYCAMQKKYWISEKEEIKNPYYGKQMLTCGKVTDTIK